MSISTPFIRRPIATSLLGLAVLLGGVLGYWNLPVSSLPQVDFPTIQVTTQAPGANPETVAALVTAPLERQMGQIPSLTTMTSSSAFGISQVTLQFGLDRDIDAAAQDVQAAINAAASTLPKTLPYPPTYSKVNPADAPILTLALRSPTYEVRQLSDMADTLLAQRLSEVSGVGHVSVQGGVRPAIRIQADLQRLASYAIGMDDLRTAIVNANVAGPKGSLDGAHQSYTLAANDQITSADAYKSVVVAYRNNAPVLLSDVADVVDGLENAKVAGWYEGQPALIIDIQRQPGANVVETVRRLQRELPRLQRTLPADVTLTVAHDRTGTIRASIADVQFTLALSVGLVVLVVLLFLRTVRATLIAGVALPLSLIATFGVMWFAGFSLDNLSLMALTIGTGFVVDDAIVMIENIVRHIERGEKPLQAALDGAREIGFTVVSLTLSLVAVFIPLLFMTGLVGRMFREFALTLTIAVVASAIVSLTLTPMMCALILKGRTAPDEAPAGRGRGRPFAVFGRLFDAIADAYAASLGWAVQHGAVMLAITFGTLAATVWLYAAMPKGFLPPQDTGLLTAVTQGEPTASFAAISRAQVAMADAIRRDPDVTGVAAIAGVGPTNLTPNTGRLTITLKPRTQRASSAEEVIARLRERTAGVPGVRATFQMVQDIQITTRSSRAAYQYTLTGADGAEVTGWAARLARRIAAEPGLRDVGTEGGDGGGQIFVDVDRDMAARLGVSMQTINDTLNSAFGQRQISTIYAQANQYRVILEAQPRYQQDSASLGRLYLSSSAGAQVPLTAVATIRHRTAPLVIQHDEQFPAETISFDLAPGASLGDAVAAISRAEAEIGMPDTVTGRYSGEAAEFARSLAGQPWLILAAVVTIYIVLGVLYESAIHPLTILSTLPSAGVGALLALILTGRDLSLVALIGIVLLMGIVKKNAIMMIDFALDAERTEGLSPRDAIVKACRLRFRPIMMTTLAALLGALPLALEDGVGSELRNPLGISIVGGLLLSQLITLYTTPVIYLALENLRLRLGGAPLASLREDAAPAPSPALSGERP
ncbi:efflux RND transporter permease subunit [Alsobacter sp. KACC 23698]|uniref:Efflux RND transporter permease subunit n=1 Tax=Alsobacter sp. KACC 23698 TaxID=3149229 RepID=A0AAU7JI63_9HYPH